MAYADECGGNTVENTGKLEWTFNSSDQTYWMPSWTVCQFVLFNGSIASCSYGPWGLTLLVMAGNRSEPISYSPIFDFSQDGNPNGVSNWINKEDTTASSTQLVVPITSTMNVTCPPSGIPPVPNTIVTQTDVYPPLATGLAFPSNPSYEPYVFHQPQLGGM